MELELVIFDVDGLMLDTEARWQQAWQEVGLKHGIEDLGTTTFLRCVGRNGKIVEDIVYEDLKGKADYRVVLNEARIHGRKLLDERIDPKPGLYDLLDYLNQLPVKKAVATATEKQLTYDRLARLDLLKYFDYLICGNEVTKLKPNPEIYQKVLAHFDVLPSQALVLEDSVVGVEAAYRAGIDCIMVPDLIKPTEKQKNETIAIVDSLLDVIDLIKNKVKTY